MKINRCKHCGGDIPIKRPMSQKLYNLRLYCSRSCQHRHHYEKHGDHIRRLKSANMKRYRQENPEKYRRMSYERKKKQRQQLLDMYGNVCVVCGFDNPLALTLDHINGDGNKERRKHGEHKIYRLALEKYQPKKYRTLCMNCQFIERQKSGSGCDSLEVAE